ncbi:MAG: hypothetical protein Q7T56_12655 [Nocardioidaceae bacterium]|nr:hypothetical protein [Nocardioidaceae bacterium]
MARPIAHALLATTTVLGLTLAVGAPAGAAETRVACGASLASVRTCAGIQTSGGDVRGYARVTTSDRSLAVSVLRVELQRRPCGGRWASWTTRSGAEGGGTSDSLATTFVVRPARVQFRTAARYLVTTRSTLAAYSVTRTSPAYGTC